MPDRQVLRVKVFDGLSDNPGELANKINNWLAKNISSKTRIEDILQSQAAYGTRNEVVISVFYWDDPVSS